MKTGLGIYKKFRIIYAHYNVICFWLKKSFLGFDVANQFLQRVDKISIQLILKKNGAKIGENCDIETGLIFHNCKNYKNLILGNNCHIGNNCFFDLRDKIIMGNNVVISMLCSFITHIDLNKSNLSKKFSANQSKIIIKDNCYIGVDSTILKGITLSKSSFVAAKSLVNKDVETNTLVGGVPIKILNKMIVE